MKPKSTSTIFQKITNTKTIFLVFIALTYTQFVTAQNAKVGATATAPNASAMLDVDGITGLAQAKGILIPRITNVQRLAMNPLPAAAQGLLVYQTDVVGASLEGFYYNISTTVVPNWAYLDGKTGWEITGNNNVTAANNFIGTIIPQDFVVKTNGAAAVNERMRVLSGGQVVVNNTTINTVPSNDVFSVYGNGTTSGTTANISALGDFAINGYTSGSGFGIYGENTGTGTGVVGNAVNRGVEGDANSATGLGVFGINLIGAGASVGVQGQCVSPNGLSVVGVTNTSLGNPAAATQGYGVYGQANGPAAITGSLFGVRGSTNGPTTGNAIGVYGSSASLTGFGMQAVNSNASGTGLIVSGNGMVGQYLLAGSGAAISGASLGTFSRATAANSTGELVVSNGAGLFTLAGTGSAVSGSSTSFGVVGWAQGGPAGTTRAGGYFDCNAGASFAYVGVISTLGVAYKINGNGLVATIVKDLDNHNVNLVCPEAPEALFQDYGQGQLINGSAHITLDPVLSKNIVVSESHPLRVFVQLKGDCKGVYVTNETANGFDVVELQNGNSSTKFNWTVAANRADETLSDGTLSKYSSLRFSPSCEPGKSVSVKAGNMALNNIEGSPLNQKEINSKPLNKKLPEK